MTVQLWYLRLHARERRAFVRRIEVAIKRQESIPADFIDSAWAMEREDLANARRIDYRRRRRIAEAA